MDECYHTCNNCNLRIQGFAGCCRIFHAYRLCASSRKSNLRQQPEMFAQISQSYENGEEDLEAND
jgi:hypothetical protein